MLIRRTNTRRKERDIRMGIKPRTRTKSKRVDEDDVAAAAAAATDDDVAAVPDEGVMVMRLLRGGSKALIRIQSARLSSATK